MTDDTRPGPAQYKALFEDDKRGVAILEDMIQRFVRPAVTEGGIDAVLKTFERNGQRKPLDFIAAMINRANGVNLNPEEEKE